MVWPFSSTDNATSADNASSHPAAVDDDVYSKLDPSLRTFLERESPVKYAPSTTPPPPPPPPPVEPSSATPSAPPLSVHHPHGAPPKSSDPSNPSHGHTLYADGRYNSLWRTYQPLREIENASKTDQEKLMDVLSAYKERKASIGRAALENCAGIHFELNRCFRQPTLQQRMQACRKETQALDRCYVMNSRFLKALGYLSSVERSEEEEERIQMHADKLYTQMLAQEAALREAKAAGLPPPAFAPPELDDLAQGRGVAVEGEGVHVGAPPKRPPELELLNERARERLRERTKGMGDVERDAEERAFAAEIRAGIQAGERLERHRAEVREARRMRLESGKGSAADSLQAWFGW